LIIIDGFANLDFLGGIGGGIVFKEFLLANACCFCCCACINKAFAFASAAAMLWFVEVLNHSINARGLSKV
jgi:hypothetical protein